MSTDQYHEILQQVQQLSVEEQMRLIATLTSSLQHKIQVRSFEHDIMAYAGFAKEVWKGIDVEGYLNEERNSWDR